MPVTMRRRGLARQEKGATAVVVAILMMVLLGMSAVSIDFAAASAKKQDIQGAVDAASLAIAKDCGKNPSGCTNAAGSQAQTTAAWYATRVGATVDSITPNTAAGTIVVRFKAPSGTKLGSAVFDRSLEAKSAATAKWYPGTVSAITQAVVPLAFEYCQWRIDKASSSDRWYAFDNIPVASYFGAPAANCPDPRQAQTPGVMNLDGPHAGRANIMNVDALGWNSSCQIPNGDKLSVWRILAQNVVGAFFTVPAGCRDRFAALTPGQEILVPIYASYKPFTSASTWGEVRIIGFAPFKLASSKPFKSKSLFGFTSEVNTCNLVGNFFFELIKLGCQEIKGRWVTSNLPYTYAQYSRTVDGIPLPVDAATAPIAQLVN